MITFTSELVNKLCADRTRDAMSVWGAAIEADRAPSRPADSKP